MRSGRAGPSFSPPKRKQKPPKAFPLWNLPCLEPCNGRFVSLRSLDEPYWPLHLLCADFWQGIFIRAGNEQWRSRVHCGPLSAIKSAQREQAIWSARRFRAPSPAALYQGGIQRKERPLVAFANFSAAKSWGRSGLRTIAIIKIYIYESISDQSYDL